MKKALLPSSSLPYVVTPSLFGDLHSTVPRHIRCIHPSVTYPHELMNSDMVTLLRMRVNLPFAVPDPVALHVRHGPCVRTPASTGLRGGENVDCDLNSIGSI